MVSARASFARPLGPRGARHKAAVQRSTAFRWKNNNVDAEATTWKDHRAFIGRLQATSTDVGLRDLITRYVDMYDDWAKTHDSEAQRDLNGDEDAARDPPADALDLLHKIESTVEIVAGDLGIASAVCPISVLPFSHSFSVVDVWCVR